MINSTEVPWRPTDSSEFTKKSEGFLRRSRATVLAVLILAIGSRLPLSAQTILLDEFNDPNLDGWTAIDFSKGTSYGPGIFDASSGAMHFESSGDVPVGEHGYMGLTWDESADSIFSNGFLRAKVRIDQEQDGAFATLTMRVADDPAAGAYLFHMSTDTNSIFTFENFRDGRVINSGRIPDRGSYEVNPGEFWNVEAGAVGDQLSMRVWREGESEPVCPQWVFTDRSRTEGTIGMGAGVWGNPRARGIPLQGSATFDDITFTPATEMKCSSGDPTDPITIWESPMPIPDTGSPPEFPANSLERTDLRGDVESPDDWPDLRITGKITDFNGDAIPGLKLDFWHADDQGEFGAADSSTLRGHQFTNADGNYELWTTTPGNFETLRSRYLHLYVGGKNEGFSSPLYETGMFFPEPYDDDVNGDGVPDKAYFDRVLSDQDVVGNEQDNFAPQMLEAVGADPADLARNIMTLNNDPEADGFLGMTFDITMSHHFQVPIPGDYNRDGQLDTSDLDLQALAILTNDSSFDLNNDGTTDFIDREVWVHDLKQTWIGDANLDGEFNSGDLVDVFAAGQYETGELATWSQGDWNGDRVFGSSDLVAAFADGGYEKGTRMAAAAVPEPSGSLLALTSIAFVLARRKRFGS